MDGESCPAQRSGSTARKPLICSAAQLVPFVYGTELRTMLTVGMADRICSASAEPSPPRDSRCRTHHPGSHSAQHSVHGRIRSTRMRSIDSSLLKLERIGRRESSPSRHLREHPTTPCLLGACKLGTGLTQYRLRRCHGRATDARCGKLCPAPSGDRRHNSRPTPSNAWTNTTPEAMLFRSMLLQRSGGSGPS